MQSFVIYIDGQAYQGENLAVELPNDAGALGVTHNTGPVHDLLIGPGEPERIVGMRNLNSHIQRILRRLRERRLAVERIEILVSEVEL